MFSQRACSLERCKRTEQKAKLKVMIASIKKPRVALPRSQLTHVGVSFTRQRRDVQRFIFRQNTASHPSLCKVFLFEKCMKSGGD